MSSFTVREATLQVLRELQVTKIFGNPGSTELAFLADLPNDFEYVLALQEASAVGMADGYARSTGNAALVNLHSAAGVGNAMGNIYTAYRNNAPLVIVAGQQARSLLLQGAYLASERATELPYPYIKWSVEPACPEDVPAAIARAYDIAMQPPYGPTFVSVPCDDWDKTIQSIPKIRRTLPFGSASLLGIQKLSQSLQVAKKPVLVYGSEIDTYRAYDDATELAERLNCDVWTAPNSFGTCFSENHSQFQGFLPAIPEKLSELLSQYDFILVVGAPVFTFHVPGKMKLDTANLGIYQLTVNSDSASRALSTVSLVGDLSSSIQFLLRGIPRLKPTASTRSTVAPPQPDASLPLSAEMVFRCMQNLLPSGCTVVEEAPSHRPALQHGLPITAKGGFYTMASGGLGYSLPASIGISKATPDKRTIVIIGDGSVMYSVQALWTAAQQKLPITIIVLNNSGYGAMRSFSKLLGFKNVPGIDIAGIDFSGLATSMGVEGHQVETLEEFKTQLTSALGKPYPTLIDTHVDPNQGKIY